MTIGHPQLVAAIVSEIATHGPLPFVRFMELALYHPQFGYYTREPEEGTERIGWNGDYYTSSDVHPLLGRALMRQARQIDRLCGEPDPFTVIEVGPGKGLLAQQFLSACLREFPSMYERLRYILLDRSPAMRQSQRQNLSSLKDAPVSWIDGLDELPPNSVTGLVFSNELLDAFPVHRLRVNNGHVQELYVDYRRGTLVESWGPLSTDALAAHLEQLHADWRISWPDGYETEINLQA
ncbi:MAG: SAM-dependent methyltransferase, partial [Nitrospira sp.]|nr:SAM-dependent methyltransferase [Nitrospira sp.]